MKKAFCIGTARGVLRLYDSKPEIPKLIQSFQIGSLPVSDINFTSDGNFLGIGFNSGQAVIVDHFCQKILLRLEESWSRDELRDQIVSFISKDSDVKVLTQHEAGCLQLHHLELKQNLLIKTQYSLFYVEGKLSGHSVHKSGNYAIATSDIGAIYIFNLLLGNITGIITVEPSPMGCIQDPSGLYIAVLFKDNENVYTTLSLFEIGTGRKAGEITKLDDIKNTQSVK